MLPKAVTFDCAQTLVDVSWTVDGFILDCARHVGLDIHPEDAQIYRQMYYQSLPEFLRVNLTRDPAEGEKFWRRLGDRWLETIGQPCHWTEKLVEASERLGFGRDSVLFKLYDDVRPCLEELVALGIRMSVVSNWDYSLHKVIRMFEIDSYFEAVHASLEEGFEKPDRRFFQVVLDQLGVEPYEVVHVGDNPVDDVEGAHGAGMRAVLLDRSGSSATDGSISSLSQLVGAFAWIG